MSQPNTDRMRSYRRQLLRSAFVSLFWSVILYKRTSSKFTLSSLADALSKSKSTVSRWFSPEMPNWEIDTIADIADALNLELELRARERTMGIIFTPSGIVGPSIQTSATPNGSTDKTTSDLTLPIVELVVTEGRVSMTSRSEPETRAA